MLPISNHRDHRSVLLRMKTSINDWIRLILADRNSRNLLLFLLLNLSFAFVELFYGIATNSLGEPANIFHFLFDKFTMFRKDLQFVINLLNSLSFAFKQA